LPETRYQLPVVPPLLELVPPLELELIPLLVPDDPDDEEVLVPEDVPLVAPEEELLLELAAVVPEEELPLPLEDPPLAPLLVPDDDALWPPSTSLRVELVEAPEQAAARTSEAKETGRRTREKRTDMDSLRHRARGRRLSFRDAAPRARRPLGAGWRGDSDNVPSQRESL
jgi:hypothetical protein